MANNLNTLDPVQTLRVQPVPVPEIPLEVYNPQVFGAGLAAGGMQAAKDLAQVATLQRHFDANAAAMDAEDQFARYAADKLVTYREQIQNLAGPELRRATKDYQTDLQNQMRAFGGKLTDQIAAQEYEKRAGAHMDRAYGATGQLAFQREVEYRAELMKSQAKLTVDAAGLVQRGPDGLPVGGVIGRTLDINNAAGAVQSFAKSVHNDPSFMIMKNGELVLNDAGRAAITEITVKSLNELLGAYSIKPREGMAILKSTYPGSSQSVADVLGADASRWQRIFSEGDKAQTASGLGFEAQRKFGQNDRKAEVWIRQQVGEQYADPAEASAVTAAAVNQYAHFANQVINRQNTVEAQALKAGQDKILAAGGLEELKSTPEGAAWWAQQPALFQRKYKDFSDTWKSGDPSSSFQRAAAEYQTRNDADPLHAFDGWGPAEIEEAALKVGPKLAPALRKMVRDNQTRKALDKPAIAAARTRVNEMLATKFNLQRDPADPTKPTFTGVPYETQLGFTAAQLVANEAFDLFEKKHREGAPTLADIDGLVMSITRTVVLPSTILSSPSGRIFSERTILPLAVARGVKFTIPYDQIPPKDRARIEKLLDTRGTLEKYKGLGSRQEIVERMYTDETTDYYRQAGLSRAPIVGRE